MTKIKNYPLDLEVNGGDKWIGTDSASLAKLTKNFTPDNLAKYYNDKEVVESVNQMRFFYDTVDPGDDRANGSFSFETEVGPIVPFSSISNLVFSKYTMGNDAVNNFMTDIVNSIIIIQKADNPDIYAFYALNGYEVDPSNPDFYNVALSFESGNGSVEEDEDYLVSLIQFAGAAGVQAILGSEFIDSTLTGVGEVTISLSATGTPSNLTGLRGDNTWGTLGLEAINENGRQGFGSTDPAIGWRLIGRDPSLYGNIGEDAIDFSTGYFQNESLPFGGSITNSPQIGSTGPGSFTLGNTVENNSSGGVVFGSANILNGGPNIEPTYFVGGVVLGQYNQSYGLNYYNFTSGYKNLIGDRTQQSWSDAGFPYPYPVQYWSGQIGMYNQMPSGYASVQLGYGLLSGGPFCTTVGIANDDVTLSIAQNVVNERNALNPRFIVGCGTYAGTTQNPSVGVRQNGFVVMSDGTATFPILSNAMIDAAGADSAVTKGWIQALPSTDTTYDLASTQNGTDVDVTLTGSDTTVDTVKLVAGANIVLTDSGTNEITIDAIGDALSAEQVRIEVKNTSGVTLTKGTPVYITGTVGATIRAEVSAADASDPAKMPSVGVLAQDLINNADGYAVTGGFLTNITTDPIDGLTPTENDTVYVKAGGGLTLTKPTGSDLIQNIAKVGKVSGGNAGSLVISSILRTNDVPNLTTGKIWVGTAANTAESGVVYLDEGNGRMGIGTTSPGAKLEVSGSIRVTNFLDDIEFGSSANRLTYNEWLASASGGMGLRNSAAGGHLYFSVGSERMRIDSSGNVGIGTTSPTYKLELGSGDFSLPLGSFIRFGPQIGITKASNGKLSIYGGTGATTAGGVDLYRWDGAAYSTALRLSNTGQIQLDEYGSGTFTGTATQRLAVDSSGNVIEIPIGSGPVDGSGTANYVTKWSDTDTITDSLLYDNGTQVLIGATSSAFSDDLYLHNTSGYAVSGWRVGTTTTYVGTLFNNSGVLSLEADGTRSIGFKNITNGEIVRIDGVNSRVGIGTTSPSRKLQVQGTANTALAITSPNTNYVQLALGDTDDDNYSQIILDNLTNKLQIQNGGGSIINDRGITLDSSENVGIGTASPSEKLDIEGSGSTNLEINNTLNSISLTLGAQATAARLTAGTGNRLGFGANNTADQVTISTSGNVGIGTTSPDGILNIESDTPILYIDDNGDNYADEDTQGSLLFRGRYFNGSSDLSYSQARIKLVKANADGTAGSNLVFDVLNDAGGSSVLTERMRIDENGNVGIGTTSPAYKLDVNGDIRGTAYRISSATILSGSTSVFLGSSGSTGTVSLVTTSGQGLVLNGSNVGIGTTSPSEKIHVSEGYILSEGAGTSHGFELQRSGVDTYQIRHLDGGLTIFNSTDAVKEMTFNGTGSVGIGTNTPAAKLDVNGGVRVADDAATASATNVGTLRYRTSGNNSYVDMCMQTGAATYAWVNIVQNNW